MAKGHLKTNIGQYAIVIKDKKLLLLTPAKGDFLMFVGGRLDSDEDDHFAGLKREVFEETSLELVSADPFDIKIWTSTAGQHRYGVFFLCSVKEGEIKLSAEHIAFGWFDYDEGVNSDKLGEPGKEVIRKLRDNKLI